MNISSLFKIQENNDNKLTIDPTLSEYKLFARKHLQIHIELSALANSTKCYKYWIDDDEYSDNDLILKNYIACLKQILSLGIKNGYNDINEISIVPSDECLSEQFLSLYIDVNDLIISPSRDHFLTLLEDFLSLSISLNLTEQSIENNFDSVKVTNKIEALV
ncbi:MAG: dUTP diphosphatase [Clostridiales bacterium]|nr:dUTP diphosphatase [Clostridiales bacterium]NLK23539.1 dUTPase [Clostridiales bacterium]